MTSSTRERMSARVPPASGPVRRLHRLGRRGCAGSKRRRGPRRRRSGRTRRGGGDLALPTGTRRRSVSVSTWCHLGCRQWDKDRDPGCRSVPVGLRLLLRVSHRDRISSHVEHGDGSDAGPRGSGGGASVPFLPGVQRVGADLSPADKRLASQGSWAAIPRQTRSPTRACSQGGRTTWPMTTMAGRSCSSDTRRGRRT